MKILRLNEGFRTEMKAYAQNEGLGRNEDSRRRTVVVCQNEDLRTK